MAARGPGYLTWGYGGTHMPVEDPLRCPEPRRTDDGRYWCETCQEAKHSMGDCVQGCSFTPWVKPAEQWCACARVRSGDGMT